jgi:phosphoglycerate kinase
VTKKLTVEAANVHGKRVLVRVDFNVPLSSGGQVADDTRLQASIPTVRYLMEHDAHVILCSHLGRPDGKFVADLSLRPVAARFAKLLGKPVAFSTDCVGPEATGSVARLHDGQVLLLENLRFHHEEEADDLGFAQQLAELADIYVDDAFGTAHRAHASTEGVTRFLPSYAGFLMQRELDYLGRAIESAEHPYGAIVGGAKISGKIEVLKTLVSRVDLLLIGGGMANTFLKARGVDVGTSLVEDGELDTAESVMNSADAAGVRLLLPTDAVIADAFDVRANRKIVDLTTECVPPGWRILDIGPKTVNEFANALAVCKMVFWNGPVGVFEMAPFANGTLEIARKIANLDAVTIVGGGDTDAAIEQAGVQEKISHISTGGGASLEFIEGKTLPGVAALRDATD